MPQPAFLSIWLAMGWVHTFKFNPLKMFNLVLSSIIATEEETLRDLPRFLYSGI